jgi:hypothetical protein
MYLCSVRFQGMEGEGGRGAGIGAVRACCACTAHGRRVGGGGRTGSSGGHACNKSQHFRACVLQGPGALGGVAGYIPCSPPCTLCGHCVRGGPGESAPQAAPGRPVAAAARRLPAAAYVIIARGAVTLRCARGHGRPQQGALCGRRLLEVLRRVDFMPEKRLAGPHRQSPPAARGNGVLASDAPLANERS